MSEGGIPPVVLLVSTTGHVVTYQRFHRAGLVGGSRSVPNRSSPFIVLMIRPDAASDRLAIASNSDRGLVRT